MTPYVIDEGSKVDRDRLDLFTKRGNYIKNARKRERAPESMLAAKEYIERLCQKPIINRSLSSSYNCVGLVFASRRVWIERDQLPLIFSDDGYYLLDKKADIIPGDLIVYKKSKDSVDIEHIGIIIDRCDEIETATIKLKILSQFGFDGEYIHDEEVVPNNYGSYHEYYSERKK